MTATHTPGPWTLEYYGDNEVDIYAGDVLICAMRDGNTDPNDTASEADACLIAAAPELLERLKATVSGMECECDTADSEHSLCEVCWSRQVIAKAEGMVQS